MRIEIILKTKKSTHTGTGSKGSPIMFEHRAIIEGAGVSGRVSRNRHNCRTQDPVRVTTAGTTSGGGGGLYYGTQAGATTNREPTIYTHPYFTLSVTGDLCSLRDRMKMIESDQGHAEDRHHTAVGSLRYTRRLRNGLLGLRSSRTSMQCTDSLSLSLVACSRRKSRAVVESACGQSIKVVHGGRGHLRLRDTCPSLCFRAF